MRLRHTCSVRDATSLCGVTLPLSPLLNSTATQSWGCCLIFVWCVGLCFISRVCMWIHIHIIFKYCGNCFKNKFSSQRVNKEACRPGWWLVLMLNLDNSCLCSKFGNTIDRVLFVKKVRLAATRLGPKACIDRSPLLQRQQLRRHLGQRYAIPGYHASRSLVSRSGSLLTINYFASYYRIQDEWVW
jgi:hypothetical protein